MAGSERYSRTPEDVSTVIHHAKLDENDLKSVTQVLTYSEVEPVNEYRFLELNSTLLDALHEGQSLKVRGLKEDHAVLCTDEHTFDIKEAETSNSMLLLTNLLWPGDIKEDSSRVLEEKQVCGIYYTYLEVRPCKPRIKRLYTILEPSVYKGPEYEEEEKGTLYTMYDLQNEVQASREELKLALSQMQACFIDGHWRLLEFDYHFRVLSYILNLLDENSWAVDKVSRREVLNVLEDLVPLKILEQVFSWYTHTTDALDDEGEPFYELKEKEVCRFLAEVLLRPAGRFNLQEFLDSWQQSVPEGMKTDLKYLDGIALVDRTSKPEVIWHFPETDLSEDIQERLNILFETREKWTVDEIRPYVERLATDKMNVNALLTKYARSSTVNSVKCFSAKHSK